MTEVGSVYGQALYDLAKSEALAAPILGQLNVLLRSFGEAPDFLRLLSTPNLSKQERCHILDDSFQGKLHPYVLNFLKILTEKGYARHFSDCCSTFRDCYNKDNNILPVTATTASPLTPLQEKKLTDKLSAITGKTIELSNRLDADILGGVRLDYDGMRLDDTIAHRLEAIRTMLKTEVL